MWHARIVVRNRVAHVLQLSPNLVCAHPPSNNCQTVHVAQIVLQEFDAAATGTVKDKMFFCTFFNLKKLQSCGGGLIFNIFRRMFRNSHFFV